MKFIGIGKYRTKGKNDTKIYQIYKQSMWNIMEHGTINK